MNKVLLRGVSVIFLALFLIHPFHANAAGIGYDQLGIASDKVGILPTNQWYFLKEWGRGIQLFFTSGDQKKAELELNILNEKAAELLKVSELYPKDDLALLKAFDNYGKTLKDLSATLKKLDDNVKINGLDEKVQLHQQLFVQIKEMRAK